VDIPSKKEKPEDFDDLPPPPLSPRQLANNLRRRTSSLDRFPSKFGSKLMLQTLASAPRNFAEMYNDRKNKLIKPSDAPALIAPPVIITPEDDIQSNDSSVQPNVRDFFTDLFSCFVLRGYFKNHLCSNWCILISYVPCSGNTRIT